MTLADTEPPAHDDVRPDDPSASGDMHEGASSASPPATPASRRGRRSAANRKVAYGWVDADSVARAAASPRDLLGADSPYVTVGADLLGRAPRRSPFRAGVLVPIAIIALLIGGYSATTILWPLHAVAPTIQAVQVDSIPAALTAPAWPGQGSAAVSVTGFGAPVASTQDAASIASITKVVTALVVLDVMPLALGEQGPEYRFTYSDNVRYWGYRSRGESALEVPVGGTLTQYQLLEGMLIGSANNYADRLAQNIWPNDAAFARAASDWLQAHGIPGITIVEPTGIDPSNAASAVALIPLAERALADPVIAEIVAKTSTDLPGAGHVENTNGLLVDPGVIGVKTGSLDTWNLLAAKNVTVGETPVRLYASVLGQADDQARIDATRALFTQLEAELQTEPSVTAGTTVGVIDTLWGDHVEVVTDADASVVLWNGHAGTVSTDLRLGDHRDAGDDVGTLSVKGPLDSTAVSAVLADDIEPPSIWWRLTHPLELFGLAG